LTNPETDLSALLIPATKPAVLVVRLTTRLAIVDMRPAQLFQLGLLPLLGLGHIHRLGSEGGGSKQEDGTDETDDSHF
jgi:hypothetical protein